MQVGVRAAAGHLAGIRLMRSALARMAAVLRGAVALGAVTSALLGAGRPLSWYWLAPALAVVCGWTSIYCKVAWSAGLLPWLVLGDLAVTAGLCLSVGHLVPAIAAVGTVNWVGTIVSMSVVTAQLAGTPAVSVPGGIIVAASYLIGAHLSHISDGGVPEAILLVSQAAVAAAVMVIALTAERGAVRAFTDLQRAEDAAALAASRREDERAQLRLVHNGPLTTLTMALHSDARKPSAVLSARAAATLDDVRQLAGPAVVVPPDGQVRLDERLAVTMAWYGQLRLTIAVAPSSVPADVAEAFARAFAEALENVARHAGTDVANVELSDEDGVVTVTVSDSGRGFASTGLPDTGFGLREDVAGRMAAVGGSAAVRSAPGRGTVVNLEWRRG
jgi:hypothetical protein